MSTFAKALRIDPGPAWDSLPPDAQRALGIAAITTIVSEQAYEAFERHSDDIVPAAIEQALEVGQDEMGNIFLEHFSVRMDSTKTLVIDTAAIGFPSCHQCAAPRPTPASMAALGSTTRARYAPPAHREAGQTRPARPDARRLRRSPAPARRGLRPQRVVRLRAANSGGS